MTETPSRAVADTSVFIAREVGRPLGELPDELAVSMITAGELELGVLRARSPQVRAQRLTTLTQVRSRFPLLPIDSVTASCYARLTEEAMLAGYKPSDHDTWIAATAMRHRVAIVTQDDDFEAFASVAVIRV
jgi:predicted nucleic acid-binding protein